MLYLLIIFAIIIALYYIFTNYESFNILTTEEKDNNLVINHFPDNEIIGLNNYLNNVGQKYNSKYFGYLEKQPLEIEYKKPISMNVDYINSIINPQLTTDQQKIDNENFIITKLRDDNSGKYSDFTHYILNSELQTETPVDKINEIRTSNGKIKLSDYGDTIWNAYDNLMSSTFTRYKDAHVPNNEIGIDLKDFMPYQEVQPSYEKPKWLINPS